LATYVMGTTGLGKLPTRNGLSVPVDALLSKQAAGLCN
jgi:hypothetical protein